MTTNVEIKRSHKGQMLMYVGGVPALDASVQSISPDGQGGFGALVYVPLKSVVFSEIDSVVPFTTRPAAARTKRKAA